MSPFWKTVLAFAIAAAVALALTLAFAAVPDGARGCCAYKGKHSRCVPCRPTREIGVAA